MYTVIHHLAIGFSLSDRSMGFSAYVGCPPCVGMLHACTVKAKKTTNFCRVIVRFMSCKALGKRRSEVDISWIDDDLQ